MTHGSADTSGERCVHDVPLALACRVCRELRETPSTPMVDGPNVHHYRTFTGTAFVLTYPDLTSEMFHVPAEVVNAIEAEAVAAERAAHVCPYPDVVARSEAVEQASEAVAAERERVRAALKRMGPKESFTVDRAAVLRIIEEETK